jgi:hypothetical protein
VFSGNLKKFSLQGANENSSKLIKVEKLIKFEIMLKYEIKVKMKLE